MGFYETHIEGEDFTPLYSFDDCFYKNIKKGILLMNTIPYIEDGEDIQKTNNVFVMLE